MNWGTGLSIQGATPIKTTIKRSSLNVKALCLTYIRCKSCNFRIFLQAVLLSSILKIKFTSVTAELYSKHFFIRHPSNPHSAAVHPVWHPLLTASALLLTRRHPPGQQPSNLPIESWSRPICVSQISSLIGTWTSVGWGQTNLWVV